MRTFTAKENSFIGQMVDSVSVENTYLSINMFNDIFQTGKVAFDSQAACLSFLCENGQVPEHGYMLGVYNEILERVMLLQYLEKEGLVYLVPMPSSMGALHQIGGMQKYSKRVQFSVNPSISSYLNRLMNEPLYVGETLKAYVTNGFKTLDEMALDEARKQTKISLWSMIVAIIALIATILLSRCDNGGFSDSHVSGGDAASSVDSSKTSLTVPLMGIMGVMKNSIEPKLEATMNNTADIKAKLSGTLNMNVQKNSSNVSNSVHNNISNSQHNNIVNNNNYRYPVKTPSKHPGKTGQSCVKMVKVNTCKDTVVAKESVIM